MGLGYSLTENLPMLEGKLLSSRLRDCGVLRAHETPDIEVVGVEVPDPVGPYGAKGVITSYSIHYTKLYDLCLLLPLTR